MSGIGVGLPLGWDGTTGEFFAYSRIAGSVQVGDVGVLDLQNVNTEATNNDLGKADSGWANISGISATQGQKNGVIAVCVDLNGGTGAHDSLCKWRIGMKVMKVSVGTSGALTAVEEGAELYAVPSVKYLDVIPPTADGSYPVRAILLEDAALFDSADNDGRVVYSCLFGPVDLGDLALDNA